MRSAIILLTLFAGILVGKTGIVPVYGDPADRSALEAENARLRHENAVLRRELIETLHKYSTQAGRLKRMEMSAAGTLETLDLVYAGARESELALDLQTSLSMIGRLSAGILKFCGEAASLLPVSVPENKPQYVRLSLELDKLRLLGEEAALASQGVQEPGKDLSCRILELKTSPELVILSGGVRNGVRIGMILNCGGTKIRILAVRPFTSAGCVIRGPFGSLAPGMKASLSGSTK